MSRIPSFPRGRPASLRSLGERGGRALLALLLPSGLGLLLAACDGSPLDGPPPAEAATAAPEAASSRLGVVPPAMARDLHALLESWSAAWNDGDGVAYGSHYAVDADFVNPLGAVVTGRAAITATHAFLFNPVNGPFRGTTSSVAVRRIVPLTGSLTLVDTTVSLSGFAPGAALPPGLVQWAPGVVKTRHHMVAAFQGGGWEIVAQQITAMQPGIPD